MVAFEADRQLNALDNRGGLNEFVRNFLKYHGHNRITLILDMQDFSRLAKEFRLFVHQLIYIEGKQSFRLFGRTLSTTWYYRDVDIAYLNLFQSLENLNVHIEIADFVKTGKFKFYGDVHTRYNAESGLAYFLDGIDHYDYIPSNPMEYTFEGVLEYLKRHPLLPPDSFKKGNKNKLENLPEEIKKQIDKISKENTKKFKDCLYEMYKKGEINND